MKKACLLLFFSGALTVFAQELLWKAGVYSFFDNNEFSGSSVQTSQTMAGVHLAPEVGIAWNRKFRVLVGIDLMHELGSEKMFAFCDPVIYCEMDAKPFRFRMGAFPRKDVLEKYPRMFIQDSIANYRPVMQGFFWEHYSDIHFMNIWLDWTGRQSETTREAFFMGWSGKYQLGIAYAQHFGYMRHFAFSLKHDDSESLHDNGLLLTSLGVDLASLAEFEKLDVNVGWSVGLERDREDRLWHRPQGFLSELKVEYRGLGLFNTYYKGNRQQFFYEKHRSNLYWGDPIYRSSEYNRSDIYIQFLKNKAMDIKFIYSLHFTEKNIYHEQALYATFDMNNFRKKTRKHLGELRIKN
ncbi:MAG: hypothetical protein LBD45_02220 [Bacteroidales bacterium]|jgi:hypothetical protein|nr:hypothetical protein [Bacteroidales bacterium]